ncbi:hypothetical protein WJX81_001929 [Elliptochloris bilobata]|uniref:Uncharacterized protein n=1 Tax=Elliptochloris bilobata TaxID=381761 RepID=A0AAW1SEM8_9CHLO
MSARLLGILLAGFVCATCMSVYYLTSAHREIAILRAELEHGASHEKERQQVVESHLTKLQEQVLSGETALKASDKACKGRIAAVEAELETYRKEAKEEAARLAAQASEAQAAAEVKAADCLANCTAELATARSASGSILSSSPDPTNPSDLASLAAGAAASATDTVKAGAAVAGDALQDAREAAAGVGAKVSDGAVGAAAGAAERSSDLAAALSQALRQSSTDAKARVNVSVSGNASAHDDHETGPGLERMGSSQEL